MSTGSLGPFPSSAVIVALALLAGWLAARLLAWRRAAPVRRRAGAVVMDAALIGLLAARLGFIIAWWPEYAAAPWSVLAIGDGGFIGWLGLAVAMAFAGWRSRSEPALKAPVLAGIVTGMAAWLALAGALAGLQRPSPLPELVLTRLDATTIRLADQTGQPLVVNLWATWCPPCRREMPVLEEALQRHPGVRFLLINQGEEQAEIAAFLQEQGLASEPVLLDPHSQAMQQTGARVLPTTLFFDRQGRHVHTHTGELTRASLASTLQRHFGPAEAPDTAGNGP